MVIAFDDTAETVQSFTTDAVALKNAIDSITPTDRRTRLKLAYQLGRGTDEFRSAAIAAPTRPASRTCTFSPMAACSIATDLACTAMCNSGRSAQPMPQNVAVVATVGSKRNYENPSQVQVFARLAEFRPRSR